MDLAPLVRAVEVLMTPRERGSREAWLVESARLVREAGRAAAGDYRAGDRHNRLPLFEGGAGTPDDERAEGDSGEPGGAWRPADPIGELEALLRLPGDIPGWLRVALHTGDHDRAAASLPEGTEGSDALLRVVTLRCALAAGIASLQPMRPARPVFGMASDDSAPALPTTQELRVSFGLRGREPQVALLAAEGLSNADIAQRLRLSAHTVRHYLERVLDRLGLHTRKALALRLMAGGKRR
jgi:DNA-binding CsgD family transcriptional regulator